jgi:hypothetical protein
VEAAELEHFLPRLANFSPKIFITLENIAFEQILSASTCQLISHQLRSYLRSY